LQLSRHVRKEGCQGHNPMLAFAQHITRCAGSGLRQPQFVKNPAMFHTLLDQFTLILEAPRPPVRHGSASQKPP
jgi:hypothetical protein